MNSFSENLSYFSWGTSSYLISLSKLKAGNSATFASDSCPEMPFSRVCAISALKSKSENTELNTCSSYDRKCRIHKIWNLSSVLLSTWLISDLTHKGWGAHQRSQSQTSPVLSCSWHKRVWSWFWELLAVRRLSCSWVLVPQPDSILNYWGVLMPHS